MAFIEAGTLTPYGAPVLRREIIANSITVTRQDSVKIASGFIALGTAGAAVAGHVIEVGTKDGVGVLTTGVAGAAVGSYVGTYLTASDNQTVGKVKAELDLSQSTIRSEAADATIGTTTGSNLMGYRLDLVSEEQLDESTAVTTTAQYASLGVNQENSARIDVIILESQIFNT